MTNMNKPGRTIRCVPGGFKMRRRISLRGCVRPSVHPSIPSYFQTRTRRILCRVSGLVLFKSRSTFMFHSFIISKTRQESLSHDALLRRKPEVKPEMPRRPSNRQWNHGGCWLQDRTENEWKALDDGSFRV